MDTDRDFTPTVEMLVHEFDDEATLDEEEEIEPADSQLLELEDLQRVIIRRYHYFLMYGVRNNILTAAQERDMPLEELLSMYGYGFDESTPDTASTEVDSLSGQETTVGNSNSDTSESSVPTKTRSKLKYLRENHVSESSMS